MKKVVLTFGLLSGVLSSAMMFATVPFIEAIGFDRGVFVGYTAIVISFLFVYFGIRSYRDNVLGGQMTFGKGFQAGILITLISCGGRPSCRRMKKMRLPSGETSYWVPQCPNPTGGESISVMPLAKGPAQ